MYFIDARVPSVRWAFALSGLYVCVCASQGRELLTFARNVVGDARYCLVV
jgi:hypothetical protein